MLDWLLDTIAAPVWLILEVTGIDGMIPPIVYPAKEAKHERASL